jgi:hypothetical protein
MTSLSSEDQAIHEPESEHIARDIREGRFPKKSKALSPEEYSLYVDIKENGGVIELWHPDDLRIGRRLVRRGVLIDMGNPEEGEIKVAIPNWVAA